MQEKSFWRGGAFPHLDGLRGIAILLVLVHHLAPELPRLNIVANGRFGVTLFFVLSGFLITSLLLRELRDAGQIDVRRFLARRIARVCPAYGSVLALYLLAVLGLGLFSPALQQLFISKLLSLLSFSSNWHPRATEGPFFVAWSLAAEMQFYLALVLVMRVGRVRALVGLSVFILAVRCVVMVVLDAGATLWWMRGVEESIWVGVLAALLASRPSVWQALERWVSRWLALALLATILALLALTAIPHKHGVLALLVALLSALCVVSCAHSRPTPLLSNRVLEHLGRRSYGIYLTHMIAILVIRKIMEASWALLLALPLALLAAELLHHWVEAPGGRWLSQRLQRSPISTLAMPSEVSVEGAR